MWPLRQLASKRYRALLEAAPEPADTLRLDLSADPVRWTEQVRILRGAPFSFLGRPYLHQIYRERVRETYIVKGRQTEVTELLVNLSLFNAYHHPNTIAIYMSSTQPKVYEFSNDRVRDGAILTSPTVRQILPPRDHHVTRSRLANGSKIFYKGAWNRYEESRGVPTDYLYLDEMQSQDVEHIDVALEALSHPPAGRLVGVGTGDYEDTAWFKRWHMGTQYRWEPGAAAWVVEADGDPQIHSYHIPQTIVPWISDAEIERKFNAALSEARFRMEVLGEWVRGVRKPITEAMMRACFDRDLSMVDVARTNFAELRRLGPILCGLDFGGGTRSHTVLWTAQAVDPDIPVMRLLDVRLVDDRDVAVQAQKLVRLLEMITPDVAVMDEGGGIHQMQTIEARFGGGVHKCHFSQNYERPLNLDKLYDANLATVNRTHVIEGVIDFLARPHPAPAGGLMPRYQLPAADPKRLDWIIPHFTCLTATALKTASGHSYIRYDKEPEDVHDALMAAVYAYVAYRIWLETRRRGDFAVGSFN